MRDFFSAPGNQTDCRLTSPACHQESPCSPMPDGGLALRGLTSCPPERMGRAERLRGRGAAADVITACPQPLTSFVCMWGRPERLAGHFSGATSNQCETGAGGSVSPWLSQLGVVCPETCAGWSPGSHSSQLTTTTSSPAFIPRLSCSCPPYKHFLGSSL